MTDHLMTPDLVCFDLEAQTKEEAIAALAEQMNLGGRLLDKEGYIADVLKREATYSTAVGFGLATPHAKTSCARTTSIAFARLKTPVQWDDEEAVSLVFQLAVPAAEQGDRHLQILAALSRKLIHEDVREKLQTAAAPEEIIALVGEV